jgi:hypothetical protein
MYITGKSSTFDVIFDKVGDLGDVERIIAKLKAWCLLAIPCALRTPLLQRAVVRRLLVHKVVVCGLRGVEDVVRDGVDQGVDGHVLLGFSSRHALRPHYRAYRLDWLGPILHCSPVPLTITFALSFFSYSSFLAFFTVFALLFALFSFSPSSFFTFTFVLVLLWQCSFHMAFPGGIIVIIVTSIQHICILLTNEHLVIISIVISIVLRFLLINFLLLPISFSRGSRLFACCGLELGPTRLSFLLGLPFAVTFSLVVVLEPAVCEMVLALSVRVSLKIKK